MILIAKKRALMALFFISIYSVLCSQNYFSKRINVGGKINNSTCLLFVNDTFYVPTTVYEVPYNKISTSLVKITKVGNVLSSLRFKPLNSNYFGGLGAYYRNNKIYTTAITDWGLQLQQGLYTFDLNTDTVFTRSYGDTVFYNTSSKILPFLRTKNKLLLVGGTDSTCGNNHPGLYKPIIRVVDTNGVLYQTKLYNSSCIYNSIWHADTTENRGYVISGFNSLGIGRNYIIKIDSNLNTIWNKNFDTTSTVSASAISLRNGNYIYAHNHTDSIQASTFYWDRITLTKIDVNGNIIWRKKYGSSEKDISVTKVKECANKDLVLCGSKYINYNSSTTQLVGWLMKTDSAGNVKWWKTYLPTIPTKDTLVQNYLYDVIELPNRDIAATGSTGGSGTFSTIPQTWLLKVDSNGCFGTFGCPADLVGINENVYSDNTVINIYPNPSIEEINIEYKLNHYDEASIQLIEIGTGKILFNKKLSVDDTNLQLNVKDLISGIYLMSFIRNNDAPVYYKLVNIKE